MRRARPQLQGQHSAAPSVLQMGRNHMGRRRQRCEQSNAAEVVRLSRVSSAVLRGGRIHKHAARVTDGFTFARHRPVIGVAGSLGTPQRHTSPSLYRTFIIDPQWKLAFCSSLSVAVLLSVIRRVLRSLRAALECGFVATRYFGNCQSGRREADNPSTAMPASLLAEELVTVVDTG